MKRLSLFFLLAGPLFLLVTCTDDEMPRNIRPPAVEELDYQLVGSWIDLQLYFVTKSPGFTPPVVSRAFAYTSLACYESLVPAIANGKSLKGQLNGLPENSLVVPQTDLEYYYPIACNAAVAQMTRYMFENAPVPDLLKIDSVENVYYERLSSKVEMSVLERSITFGKQLADSLFKISRTDGGHRGFNRNFPASYVPPQGPGLWVPTNSQLAMLPTWGNNRTFIPNLATTITVPGSPAFSTDPSSAFYEEALAVYNHSTDLTEEEERIAYFWNDDALATFTPPGHAISILKQLMERENLSLADAANAYAKMSIAQSDAFVICWKIKYAKNLIRPVTYIQQNIDEFWNSLIITPPFPEYTSGHSTQAGAAAAILNSLFGSNTPFTDKTHLKLKTGLGSRTFTSFDEMATECSNSRLYGGIHFPSGNLHGRQSGYAIGAEVLKLQFVK